MTEPPDPPQEAMSGNGGGRALEGDAPEADEATIPTGRGARIKSLAELISAAAVVLGLIWAVILFVAVLVWDARLEPWLMERLKSQLEKPQNEDWFSTRVLLALSDGESAYVEKLQQTYVDKNLLKDLRRVSKQQMEDLFAQQAFQRFFLEQVLMALSNRDEEMVREIMQKYRQRKLLQEWLTPPELLRLESRINDEVDAIYTLDLFNLPEPDTSSGGVSKPIQKLRARFFANKQQKISIEVTPKPGGRWDYPWFEPDKALFLTVGSGDPQEISSEGLLDEDITCDVYRSLRGDSGFVPLLVAKKDGYVPDNHFELDVVVTAKKGRSECD